MIDRKMLALMRGVGRGTARAPALLQAVEPSARCWAWPPPARPPARLLSALGGAGGAGGAGGGAGAGGAGAGRPTPRQRVAPELKESDLQESFVKGSGKGGQKINKVRNCVLLTHVPSGLQVRCQKTRSLDGNRRAARKLLLQKLDDQLNGALSQRSREMERLRRKKASRRAKAKRKHGGQSSGRRQGQDEDDESQGEDDEGDEGQEEDDDVEAHPFQAKRQ